MQLILITGASASGKTQIAKGLLARLHFIFGEESACLISQDHYYYDLPQVPNESNPATNFDHPNALDFKLLKVHIDNLFSGLPIHMPLYDFATHSRLKHNESVKPSPIIIIEGIHALYDHKLFERATLKVFVETPQEVCLERRLKRDMAQRARAKKDILHQYYSNVLPMFKRFIYPTISLANIIVDGQIPTDISVQRLLSQVDLSELKTSINELSHL